MDGIGALIFPALVIVVFYFMLIRPQRKRVEQHKALVESISVGDEVVTIGGLFGTVRALRGDSLELEVAPGTVVRLLKSSVARTVSRDATGDVAEQQGEDEGA